MTASTTRAAVLISGEGSNLQALLDSARAGTLGVEIAVVVSNRAAARGLERARNANVPALHVGAVRGMTREDYDVSLLAALAPYEPDLVVLAGFMRIFSVPFVEQLAGRMLNVHPALLPSYKGLDTHRRVLEAGESWHGATVHFVTAELDSGPSVLQYRLRVRSDDTPESLAERVHRGEHIILPRAVQWFGAGRLRLAGGSVMLDDEVLSEPVVVESDA